MIQLDSGDTVVRLTSPSSPAWSRTRNSITQRYGRLRLHVRCSAELAHVPWKQLPVPYRRESSRLCNEDDKSPSLSHMTDDRWQKPAA